MNHKCKIFKITNYSLEIYYSYNPTTTLGEFSEFLCSLYPKKFCPCFKFKYDDENKYIILHNKLTIQSCEDYIDNLRFINDNPNCQCKQERKEYLNKTKIDLYNQKIELENKLRELSSIIDKLKEDNIILENKNNMLKNSLVKEGYNIKEINSQIQIENKLSGVIKIDNEGQIKIKEKYAQMKSTDFYDIVIKINSIKDIIKGWEVQMSKRALEKYDNITKENAVKIGVFGNLNKGKSFILSKISGIKLPIGTEGLSIKYPETDIYSNRHIVLLDSPGLGSPVLKCEEKELEENNIEENKINNIKNEKEILKKKSRDKIFTDLFLRKYIINYSDVLILVVGALTYSDQKLLNKIKTEMRIDKLNKTLYVIHNLKIYTSIKQVQNYIENILLKNAVFDLKKQIKIYSKFNDNRGEYFYEKKEIKGGFPVYHLIFANEGSEAGNYYNKFTLQFIEGTYKFLKGSGSFDAIKAVKDLFKELAKNIIEKPEKDIKFDNSDNLDKKYIKLYQPENIILKKCYIEELGFSNFKSNGFFEPNYNCYKKDDQIIVRVEAPGNSSIESRIEIKGENTFIKINGTKIKDKEPEELEQNIYNSREIGSFSLRIPLKTEEYLIKNELPKIEMKNGVFILYFKLEEKPNKIGRYNLNKEDEI